MDANACILWPSDQAWPKGIDPYLKWANLTSFRYVDGFELGSGITDHPVQLIVECTGELRDVLRQQGTSSPNRPFEKPFTSHLLFADSTGMDAKVGTFSVTAPLSLLKSWLENHADHIRRLELSAARAAPKVEKILEWSQYLDVPMPPKIKGKSVVAIIDDGLPFLHERFRESGNPQKTRIRYFWDQTPEKTVLPCKSSGVMAAGLQNQHKRMPWLPVYRFGYGRELTAADIDKLTQQGGSEHTKYHELDHERALPDRTHGSHVADLAAGGLDEDIPVIMVQLPGAVVQDTSGGGTAKHVVDAILYILDRVEGDASVVINLSFGTHAGPHDGSSLIERAMDAISEQQQKKRGFLIVLPAGNAFNSQGHAQLELANGQPQELTWNVRFDDPTESFCELWWPKGHWKDLEITLLDPSGKELHWLHSMQGEAMSTNAADQCVAALLGAEVPAAGDEKSQVLIALSPTKANSDGLRVNPGLWKIRLRNRSNQPFTVDAWIQRDDSPMNTPGAARQSFFLSNRGHLRWDEDDASSDPVKRMGTGNSLAHGQRTLVIGGVSKADDRPSAYSAAGLNGSDWPDAMAVSEEGVGQPGLLAAGTQSNSQFRMNGTSVAAPQFTRAIAKYWQNGGDAGEKNAVLDAILGRRRQSGGQRSEVATARSGNERRLK